MKGLSRDELQPCCVCGKGLAHNGIQCFKVHIESHLIDPNALKQHTGMEMLTSPEIASVLSPVTEFTKPVIAVDVVLCQGCAIEARFWQVYAKDGD
ncbi:MAG: hypothetical protein OES13_00205 [Acidimicrobiia bacterium]|nr:hypothetical protein [Acidimicrobiia bacterium]